MAEALRLADELDDVHTTHIARNAADELRRLHAENETLAAALASSCDEQRHELWESGGIAGCERARVAERQRDALLEALKLAWPIIEAEKYKQDCSYGKNFVQTKAERARKAYEATRAAIKAVEGEKT